MFQAPAECFYFLKFVHESEPGAPKAPKFPTPPVRPSFISVIHKILTLCVGNICRSPFAEALLAKEFPQKTVWSAGLSALVGHPADPFSIKVAAAYGIDLSAHRAMQVNRNMCESADLILVMEQNHKTELENKFAFVRGKVFRLGELGKFDIPDPFMQPQAVFETTLGQISVGVAQWASRIRQLD